MKKIFRLLFLLFPLIARSGDLSVTIKASEEKQIPGGPKVRFDSVGHESASNGPDEIEQTYAVFHFTLSEGGKSGKISAPVETEAAPFHTWEKYKLKVIKSSPDYKTVTIMVLKK